MAEMWSEVTFYAPRMFVHTRSNVLFFHVAMVPCWYNLGRMSVTSVWLKSPTKDLQVLVLEGADVVVLQHQQLLGFKQS